jgi:hypothetical protein
MEPAPSSLSETCGSKKPRAIGGGSGQDCREPSSHKPSTRPHPATPQRTAATARVANLACENPIGHPPLLPGDNILAATTPIATWWTALHVLPKRRFQPWTGTGLAQDSARNSYGRIKAADNDSENGG